VNAPYFAPYLTPVARPPHDPRTITLDARLGWRAAKNPLLIDAVSVEPLSGGLQLDPVPGTGRVLSEPSGSFGGLTWPDHVAALPDGSLVLLDRRKQRLLVLDRCACAFVEWPCLRENDVRLRAEVTGITVVCDQLLLVAPDLHRIIVVNARNGALRGIWTGLKSAMLKPWVPTDAAVTCDRRIVVSDAANGGLHVLSPRGLSLDFIAGLGAVRSLAIDCDDRVYARSDGEDAVAIVDLRKRQVIGTALRPEELYGRFPCLPIHVYATGAIDIGPLCEPPSDGPVPIDASGAPLPASFADAQPRYPKAGSWISAALDSEIAACVWDRIALCGLLPLGACVEIATLTAETELADDELGDPGALWRVAGLWRGEDDPALCASTDFMLRSPPGRYLWLRLRFASAPGGSPRLDCAMLDFPRISLRRYLPGIFGADPIAAEFTDRWLAIFDRGLRDVESEIDEQGALFDPLAAPTVPDAPPERDFLAFLASWVGITLTRAMSLERRRRFVQLAPRLYAWRGTVRGLRDTLYLFLGLDRWIGYQPQDRDCVPCVERGSQRCSWCPPRLILEHFQLRRWLALDHARLSDAAKLWGARIVNRSRLESQTTILAGGSTDGAQVGVTQLKTSQDPYRDPFHVYAHRLSIFVPAACARRPALARAFQQLVDSERPAHVQANVVFVEPRFRVGVQAMLGLDAVIGVRPVATVLDATQLGHGTVLAAAGDQAGQPRAPMHVGAVRVGMNTLLP
jgi:phage tail-like protein